MGDGDEDVGDEDDVVGGDVEGDGEVEEEGSLGEFPLGDNE